MDALLEFRKNNPQEINLISNWYKQDLKDNWLCDTIFLKVYK